MSSFVAGPQLIASQAEAQEDCDTIEACQTLKAKSEDSLAEPLKSVTPELTGILQKKVNQYDAEKICLEMGLRLPTARELGLVSQNLGAQGISDTPKEGYHRVKVSDSQGNNDYFFYSYKGYQRPIGDLGSYWFWSSSTNPYPHNSNKVWVLNGYDGSLSSFYFPRSLYHEDSAVRCVLSR